MIKIYAELFILLNDTMYVVHMDLCRESFISKELLLASSLTVLFI